jgi:hypothetical protein
VLQYWKMPVLEVLDQILLLPGKKLGFPVHSFPWLAIAPSGYFAAAVRKHLLMGWLVLREGSKCGWLNQS